MKTPKLWRKKGRDGRYTGNYFATVNKRDINLGTKNANTATARLAQALRAGKRNFVDDVEAAAAALEPNVGAPAAAGQPGGHQTEHSPPPASSSPAAGAPTPTASTAPPPAPDAGAVQPDAVIPPQRQLPPASTSAAEEAAATNAAATEAGAGDEPDPGAAAAEAVPPEVLEMFLQQAGDVMVQLQLGVQAFVIKKAAKREAGEIPQDAAMRKLAAQAWAAQLKVWFPADAMLPPWAMALILTATCAPVQLATSTPLKDEKPKQDAGSGAQAMAA